MHSAAQPEVISDPPPAGASLVWTEDLAESLRERALALGFSLAGIAAAPASASAEGASTAARFSSWVELGRAGEMDYLKRRNLSGELLRSSARAAMPWARSVLILAFQYNAPAPLSIAATPPGSAWIARYAWLGAASGAPTDYHDALLARLHLVEQHLLTRFPAAVTRAYVDTGPLLERDFAARAGIGWIGKNTCILHQQQGSWLLLAALVTSLEVPAAKSPRSASSPASSPASIFALESPDRCGSCTRCLDACPTGALVAPRQMDASLCIAYLTIEKKGSIPVELRPALGRHVFGCDICQDVCPWNRRAPAPIPLATPSEAPAPILTAPMASPEPIPATLPITPLTARPELINPSLDWLATLDQPAFRRHFKGSPLERTRRHRLLRNVALAMGNSGDPRYIPRLTEWSAGEDPILAEAASWALFRVGALVSEKISTGEDVKC